MEIDDFLDLVRRRRSIRKFKPDAISGEAIGKILEAGRWAMSGANAQPWEFVVVKDKETRDKIYQIYIDGRKLTHELEMTRVEELRHPGAAAPLQDQTWFRDAPVIIVVCGDTRTIQTSVLAANLLGKSTVLQHNLANATHNMQLAAAALGLGSEWVSIGRQQDEKLRALLGVPDVFVIETMVPVGYPDYKPGPGSRRELSEIVHRDKYDMSKFRSDDEVIKFIANLRKGARSAYSPGK